MRKNAAQIRAIKNEAKAKARTSRDKSRNASRQPRDKRGRFVEERKSFMKKIGEVKPVGSVVVEAKREMVKVRGKEYYIPVDDNGNVPQYALAARFTNVREGTGPNVERRNVIIDQNSEAKTVLKGKLTPEDVKEWWARPNESDIKGVDDIESTYFDLSALKTRGRKDAQGKIAVVGGTKKEQERIRKMLSESFTLKEQNALSKDGLTVEITRLTGNAGEYHGRSDGMTYRIMVDPRFLDDDTLLHEMVHHSRMVDKDRKSPLVRTRSESNFRVLVKHQDVSLEEAATVAETAARQGNYVPPDNPHYYGPISRINGKKPYKMIAEDRALFAGSAENGSNGTKGKRAIKAVEDRFDSSHISELNLRDVMIRDGIKYPDISAKDRLKTLKNNKY